MKMPTVLGIFIFISRENFMLSRAELSIKKGFITITKCLFKYIENFTTKKLKVFR